jgi:hypothetical protein
METRWSLCLYFNINQQLCITIHLNNTDGESNKVFAGFNITLGKRKDELGDKSSFTHEGLDLELLLMLINLHCYIDR